jgi:hypothetical protein
MSTFGSGTGGFGAPPSLGFGRGISFSSGTGGAPPTSNPAFGAPPSSGFGGSSSGFGGSSSGFGFGGTGKFSFGSGSTGGFGSSGGFKPGTSQVFGGPPSGGFGSSSTSSFSTSSSNFGSTSQKQIFRDTNFQPYIDKTDEYYSITAHKEYEHLTFEEIAWQEIQKEKGIQFKPNTVEKKPIFKKQELIPKPKESSILKNYFTQTKETIFCGFFFIFLN